MKGESGGTGAYGYFIMYGKVWLRGSREGWAKRV